jgi:N-acetylmuramoyl-L-alanine amidase
MKERGWLDGVKRHIAADMGGQLERIDFGVVHYTAGASLAGAEQTLTAKDDSYVSAHLVIARDGDMRQCVSFDRVAYHAGVSEWHGHRNLNTCSVGIELVNPGWYRAGFAAEWPILRTTHRNGGPVRDWYLYPPAQIDALCEVILALKSDYGLREWVGHDHIAPARKFDPGPAFPWARVEALPGIICPSR